jgi:hypothetical protein
VEREKAERRRIEAESKRLWADELRLAQEKERAQVEELRLAQEEQRVQAEVERRLCEARREAARKEEHHQIRALLDKAPPWKVKFVVSKTFVNIEDECDRPRLFTSRSDDRIG